MNNTIHAYGDAILAMLPVVVILTGMFMLAVLVAAIWEQPNRPLIWTAVLMHRMHRVHMHVWFDMAPKTPAWAWEVADRLDVRSRHWSAHANKTSCLPCMREEDRIRRGHVYDWEAMGL